MLGTVLKDMGMEMCFNITQLMDKQKHIEDMQRLIQQNEKALAEMKDVLAQLERTRTNSERKHVKGSNDVPANSDH